MGTALLVGVLGARTIDAQSIRLSDCQTDRVAELAKRHGVGAAANNRELVRWANLLVLAVKPQQVNGVLKDLEGSIQPGTLLVSIAAGISTAHLEGRVADSVRVVRAMPNAPLVVKSGVTALCRGLRAQDADLATARELFESVGQVVEVPEGSMDAVTGLSGSGPAFVLVVIEALSDAGVRAGLPRGVARTLAAQTVLGAARWVLESGEHPSELRDRVTSPAGTTIAGLAALEQAGLRHALLEAVRAATARAQELGKG